MRTLDQIASEQFMSYAARDVEALKMVKLETVESLRKLFTSEFGRTKVNRLIQRFWEDNPR